MANENMNPSQNFYEQICAAGSESAMSKQASEDGASALLDSLQNSGFSTEQMEILASKLDEGIEKKSSSVEDDLTGAAKTGAETAENTVLSKIASELTPEDYEGNAAGNAILQKFASELCNIAVSEELDINDEEVQNGIAKLAAEAIADSLSSGAEGEVDEDEFGKIAEEYDETYAQLVDEGYTIADYAMSVVGNEKIAAYIGENSEKLAAVSGVNPLMVADDLLAKIEEQLPEE